MGFIEQAPRPRPRSIAPAWWVTLGVIAAVAVVWLARRSEPSVESTPGSPAVATVQTPVVDPLQAEQIVHLQQLLHQAEAELADQEDQIGDLERQLDGARADAERNRQAMERALAQIDRLNDQVVELEAAVSSSRSSARMPPAPARGVAPLGAPFVSTSQFGFVVASGLVYNPTDYPERGTLEVSLVGSEGVIDTRGFVMTVGAGRTERYDVTFTNVFPTERLGAQARWVP